jgi:alpha-tubulin suppressor-like RCC1 family protein
MKQIFTTAFILFVLTCKSQCWKQVSTGVGFTLAIKNDGTLWGWGFNTSGQLGIGNTTNKLWPTQVGTATDWMMVAAGGEYSFAIKNNGTLWAWGANSSFLGLGYNSISEPSPLQVGTSNNWAFVYPGLAGHTLALKTDGTLWAWGYNGNGELGIGNNTNYNTPQQIGTGSNWLTASAGSEHSLGIKTDGTLWAWGVNVFGQLGIGNNTSINIPVQLGTATNWKTVAAGYLYSNAIKTDGTLWSWGRNDFGQLGTGNTTHTNSPAQEITLSNNWKTITNGQTITEALKTDNTLWAWGYGYNGDVFMSTSTPEQVGIESNWDTVAVKWNHGLGIKTGNTLWAWGDNFFGELGDGTTNASVSVQVTCNVILPLTWLSVTSKLQNGQSIIDWATATESNTENFIVEHSIDGRNYTALQTLPAAGYSSSRKDYQYTHAAPVYGSNYYRIKQTDLDGRFTYSSVVVVKLTETGGRLIVFPNPATNFIQLLKGDAKAATLRIFSADGKLVWQQQLVAGIQQESISVTNLPAGLYQLQLQTNDGIKTTSFIKQ